MTGTHQKVYTGCVTLLRRFAEQFNTRVTSAAIAILVLAVSAEAQPVFGDRGFSPRRETFSQLPFEHIDPLTGNLLLTYTDLALPGNAGFDLRIQRTYNSKIYRDYANLGEALEEDSWAGVGWTLHFGRVFHGQASDPANPIIEMPDGSRHQAYPHIQPPAGCGYCFITKDYWIYDKNTGTLMLTDGVRYTMGHPGTTGAAEGAALYTTTIADPFGNTIAIEYYATPSDAISRVTQDLGGGQTRQVTFTTGAAPRLSLASMVYLDRTWIYQQEAVAPATDTIHSHLTRVTPPQGPAWTFEYNTSFWPRNELTKVTLPAGGTVSYAYQEETFYLGVAWPLRTRVVASRTIGGRGIPAGTWTFQYAFNIGNGNGDHTIITGPCNTITYRFEAVGQNAHTNVAWWTGLPISRSISGPGGGETQSYGWIASKPISTQDEVLGGNVAQYTLVPLLSGVTTSKDGQTFGIGHDYSDFNFNDYGRPWRSIETGNRNMYRVTTRGFIYGFAGYIVDRIAGIGVATGTGPSEFATGSGFDLTTGFRTAHTVYGVTTTYSPTSSGNVANQTDANGHTTFYGYSWGTTSSVQTPEFTITRVINPDGTVASEKRREFTTQFTYDKLMRRRSETPPLGNLTATDYDDTGGGTFVRVSRGTSFVKTYLDGFGREVGTVNTVGVTTDKAYDACGNTTYASHPYDAGQSSYGTSFTYDGLGRVTRRTNPDPTTPSYSTFVYSGIDVTITDEEGRVTTQEFSAFGDPNEARLTAVNQVTAGTRTEYTYNLVGSLTKAVPQAPNGPGIRQWVYNWKNQLESETHPENATTSYERDNVGNVTSRIGAAGTTRYGYDGNDRLKTITYPNASENVTFGYDASDNRTSMSNGSVTTTWEFDDADRLKLRRDVIDGRTFSTKYDYDANDNLKRLDYPSGRAVKYTYDTGNRLTGVTNGSDVPYASLFSYHPTGALLGFTSGNGVAQTFAYDRRLRLSSISSAPLTLTYGYDRVGNTTSTTDARPGFSSSFGVDAFDRLATVTGFGAASFGYDALGNRTSKTTTLGTLTFTIDPNTQRLSSTSGYETAVYQYDALGRLMSDGSTAFTYSADSMLKTATTGGVQTTYAYDPDQARAKKGANGGTTYYLYGPSQHLLSEFEITTAKPFGWIRDYIYAGDRLIAGASCGFSLDWTTKNLGNFSWQDWVIVSTSPDCAWSASSDSTWVTVAEPPGKVGSGAAYFSVAANPIAASRTARLTIAGQIVTLVQSPAWCTPSTSLSQATFSAAGGSGSVAVTAAQECAWNVSGSADWITFTSSLSGSGNGTVTYTVAPNPLGILRARDFTIAGRPFTVVQSAAACNPSASPPAAAFTAIGGTGSVALTITAGCPWTASSGAGWISFPSGATGSGNATVSYAVAANLTGLPRSATISIASQTVTVSQSVRNGAIPISDVDGDGKSDVTAYNESLGYWYTLLSTSGALNTGWGGVGYAPVAGDFDGDGKADRAVYQVSTANWYVLLSGTGYATSLSRNVGGAGWEPAPADYDGDRKTDFVAYNTSTGQWFGLLSGSNYTTTLNMSWGGTGYTAVPGDFDGDGRGDVAVYQVSTGNWYVVKSGSGYTTTMMVAAGGTGYNPVQADYDGDGRTDFVVYNVTTGLWYGLLSATSYTTSISTAWGGPGYRPVCGDYDGDGKADLAAYQESTGTWSVLLSGAGFTTAFGASWGGPGYGPVPRYW